METSAAILKIDGENFVQAIQKAREELECADGELLLDFSGVQRIHANGMMAIQELVEAAEHKALKVVLRGVNVETYKVLKLVKLTTRFTFTT